ncbi:MAG: diguanylate cyclase [Dethiosulfovibrio sp.]|nr:diguanylate cyclase [Dethiosulfovibrio sp.]
MTYLRLMNENPSETDLSIFSSFMEWLESYNGRDVDGVMASIDPDVLSVGTGWNETNLGSSTLAEGFAKDFKEATKVRFTDGEVYVRSWDDWGWLLFRASYEVEVKGETLLYRSRRTVVYRRNGDGWAQVHIHHSIPDGDQAEGRSFPVGPEASSRYALLFSSFRDGIMLASADSRRILEANEAAEVMYGLPEHRLSECRLDDLMPKGELNTLLERIESCPEGGLMFQSTHMGPKGDIPVEVTLKRTVLEERSVILVVVRDISERVETERALRRSEERLRMTIEANDDCLWELDVQTMTLDFEGAKDVVGQISTLPYSSWLDRVHPDDASRFDSSLMDHLYSGEDFRVEYRLRVGENRWIWVLDRGSVVERDHRGRPVRMLGTLMNIDRRKRIEEERLSLTRKLERMATIDGLTGILNRQRFEELVQGRMGDRAMPMCLIMFDLDRFKDLNDSQGHQAGDRALIRTCESVTRRLRRDDLFCRWGGDEFMVALEQDLERTALVAQDLKDAISNSLKDEFPSVTASFGVAPWDGFMSLDDLAFQADDALYRAKKKGRNQVVVFGSSDYN